MSEVVQAGAWVKYNIITMFYCARILNTFLNIICVVVRGGVALKCTHVKKNT